MSKKQNAKLIIAFIAIISSRSFAKAEDLDDAGAGATQYTRLSKETYESEALALETWKSNVRGTYLGDKLLQLLSSLDKSLVRNPQDSNALFTRGYLYGTVGCTRAAIVDLSKAINQDAMSAHFYSERALCYMDIGEYYKARSDLNMALYLNPNSGDAHLARGRLLLLLGLPELALSDLITSKDVNQEYKTILPGELPGNFYGAPDYYLGSCYELLGNHTEAIQHFLESAKESTGADNGYIHRYADRPLDAELRAGKLRSG